MRPASCGEATPEGEFLFAEFCSNVLGERRKPRWLRMRQTLFSPSIYKPNTQPGLDWQSCLRSGGGPQWRRQPPPLPPAPQPQQQVQSSGCLARFMRRLCVMLMNWLCELMLSSGVKVLICIILHNRHSPNKQVCWWLRHQCLLMLPPLTMWWCPSRLACRVIASLGRITSLGSRLGYRRELAVGIQAASNCVTEWPARMQ